MATRRTHEDGAAPDLETSKYYEIAYGASHLGMAWKWEMPAVFALPFVGSDAILRPGPEPEDAPRVVARRTAASALGVLASMGLDDRYFRSTWEGYRDHYRLFSLGTVEARQPDRPGSASARERLERVDAAGEIDAAVRVLHERGKVVEAPAEGAWADIDWRPVPFLPTSRRSSASEIERAGVAEALAFADFLSHCREWLPDIADVYESYLLLRAIPGDAEVALTLPSVFVRDPREAADYIGRFVDITTNNAELYSRTFAALTDGHGEIQRRSRRHRLASAWRVARDGSANGNERGRALEEFVSVLLEDVDELGVVERNLRTETAEVDVVVRNNVGRPFWLSLASPLILVECKNWAKRADVREARVLESKMRDRGSLARLGIFVSLSGFTAPFHTHQESLARAGLLMIAISSAHVEQLLGDPSATTVAWLERLIAEQAAGRRPQPPPRPRSRQRRASR